MANNQPYLVSARKYRPATFQSVVGQRALTDTLKNAISGGRLAQAYLFCGPRGVGKTSCARIFAKTINCLNPTAEGEACGECESCKAIERGASFNLVELDAASNNSVEDIRNITDQVNIPPQNGRYRVFIIDEVHMLSNSAFNAFLKTLEEPPKNVVFILATTERHKVIPTILSRCQIYDFRRITVNDIIDHLAYVAQQEGIEANREALGIIALKADGAMRDALSIFDQVSASTGGRLSYDATVASLNVLDTEYYFRLIDIFKTGDPAEALIILKEVIEKGFDPQFFINGLASHVRNLMVAADARTLPLLETSEELALKYAHQAPSFPADWYYKALQILNDCDFNYRLSGNKRLLVEISLIKLCRILDVPFVNPDAPQSPERPDKEKENDSKGADSSKSDANNAVKPKVEISSRQKENQNFVKKSSGVRPTSFRLSDQKEESVRHNRQEDKLENPFTPEELSEAWEEFIRLNPEQRILVAAMRGGVPEHISGFAYKATVSHPAQQQAYEGIMPELLKFLRERLKNNSITLRIDLSETVGNKNFLSPREFLKLTVEENPELAKFLKKVEAELE